jgi:hypothetical protein
MALSSAERKALRIALGSKQSGSDLSLADSIADKIDDASNNVAANVPLLGSTTNLVGVDGTGSNAAPLVGTESRLDAIEAKVDALISAMISGGVMNP